MAKRECNIVKRITYFSMKIKGIETKITIVTKISSCMKTSGNVLNNGGGICTCNLPKYSQTPI